MRPQDGASFTTWDGISFTRLTNVSGFEAIAEHELGHGVSVMGCALHLLQRDLMCLVYSKPRPIDLVQTLQWVAF